jgi:hypothetical protein
MIIQATVIENSAVTILARVRNAAGEYLAAADVTSITAAVYDAAGAQDQDPIATPTLDVADCISDTLQTDARWTVDATGYNFEAGLSGDCFPQGDRVYQVEFTITPSEGDAFVIPAKLATFDIFSA